MHSHFKQPTILLRKSRGLLLATVVVAVAGCGAPADPLNRQDVSGEVKLKGEPLDYGSISLEPEDSGTSTSGGASIEEGNFELPSGRGLAPGKYRVRITSPQQQQGEAGEAPGEAGALSPERIPAEWNIKSEQTVEVEEGAKNHFEFDIS